MKISKPVAALVCLFSSTNLFAAEAAKAAAPLAQAGAKNPAPSPKSPSLILRISAIDGKEGPNHKAKIQRKPGQKIRLSADLFAKENGKLVAQHISPEDILWRSSIYRRDCDPARPDSCKNTGISVTKEGVILTITQRMFDEAQATAKTDDEVEISTLKLKVTYVKDPKLTDSIAILNTDDVKHHDKMMNMARELRESQSTGFSGFLNAILGVSSGSASSSSDDESSAVQDEYQRHREEMQKLDALEASNPSLARDLRAIEENRFAAGQPRYQSGGRDWQRGDGGHHDWHHSGGASRWNRGDEYRSDRNRPYPTPAAPAVQPATMDRAGLYQAAQEAMKGGAAAPVGPAVDKGRLGR